MLFWWLDFWTTNSAIWVTWESGQVQLAQLGIGNASMPTALFYDGVKRSYLYWESAIETYVNWRQGRLMISIKRALWRNLSTEIGRVRTPIVQIAWNIIREIKEKAELQFDQEIDSVVIWRPVRFRVDDETRDQDAQNELEVAWKLWWFKHIEFLQEPIWGIYWSLDKLVFWKKNELTVLISDLWGWTSDFSIARVQKNYYVEVLANSWVYVWWDELTAQVMWQNMSEYLWKSAKYKTYGENSMNVPSGPYSELKYRNHLHNLRQRKFANIVSSIYPRVIGEHDKTAYARLKEMTEEITKAHKLHLLVNQVKIALSDQNTVTTHIWIFNNDFDYTITKHSFNDIIQNTNQKIMLALQECVQQANISPNEIDTVILVWGTTKVPLIRESIIQTVWWEKIVEWDTFNAVAKWLTYYAWTIFK